MRLGLGQVGEPHDLLARTSAPYGLRPETSRLSSSSSTIRPRSRSTRKSLPGCSRPLRMMFSRRLLEHARLRGEHDPAVLRLEPAARAQPVAVERRADHAPVGEGDRGRPVPGLHQALVVLVEAPQLVGHVGAALVGLGDHHHHRVRQRAPGEREQLEHVVEDGRVGPGRPDDRQHLPEVVAEQLRGELRLPRPHPVDVPAQRVDLAVVRDQPVRVGELPARERVRRVARVDERERAREARVAAGRGSSRGSCGADSIPL